MTAAGLAEIVGPASAAGRGVGAFNIIGIEHAEAVVAGAEAVGAPPAPCLTPCCHALPLSCRGCATRGGWGWSGAGGRA